MSSFPSSSPPRQSEPGAERGSGSHEPPAFESDLDRHRSNDDEVYGSHGVQADRIPGPARPGRLSGRRGGRARKTPDA